LEHFAVDIAVLAAHFDTRQFAVHVDHAEFLCRIKVGCTQLAEKALELVDELVEDLKTGEM
jgi:hypothetical protein